MSVSGRPRSPGIRLKISVAEGVKLRITSFGSRKMVATWVLSNRFRRSALARSSASILSCRSTLTVCSSSLTDCCSSFAVCSSSLVDCSSSFIETQLLVGGFQLLQRGLVFLDGGLQPVARLAQLVLQPLGDLPAVPQPLLRVAGAQRGPPARRRAPGKAGRGSSPSGSTMIERAGSARPPRPRRRRAGPGAGSPSPRCRAARRSSRRPRRARLYRCRLGVPAAGSR